MVNKTWDQHWKEQERTLYGKFCTLYRENVIAPTVGHYFKKYIPSNGIYVDCGSGTSQTSVRIDKENRKLVALDMSFFALRKSDNVRQIDYKIGGNIFKLPFRDESIDGVWNHGVLEHFTYDKIDEILIEFKRVLKKGGYMLLIIPPYFSLNGMIRRFVYSIVGFFGTDIDPYPDEVTYFRSKKEAKDKIMKNGFSECKVYFPWRNLWGDLFLICRK